jgi:hypothetical protein
LVLKKLYEIDITDAIGDASHNTGNSVPVMGASNKDIPYIEYSEEDDKATESWICDHLETTWHSMLSTAH